AAAARVGAAPARRAGAARCLRPVPRHAARTAAPVLRPRETRACRGAHRPGRQRAPGAARLPAVDRPGRPRVQVDLRWRQPPPHARRRQPRRGPDLPQQHRTIQPRPLKAPTRQNTTSPAAEGPRQLAEEIATIGAEAVSAEALEGAIGRTMFDTPGSEDMTVTV